MTAKKETKKYELSYNSKLEQPIKLPLVNDRGEDTADYLLVKSCKAKSLGRDLIETRIGYRIAQEEIDKLPKDMPEELKAYDLRELQLPYERQLACKMVVGWSLPIEFNQESLLEMLNEREAFALSSAIVSVGIEEENYLLKK